MKERLTGAIILVALLVLLVPELLTGPGPKSAAKTGGDESASVRTYTIDLADDASANRRPNGNPALAPETAVTDEPVAQASPEEGAPGDELEASGEVPAADAGSERSAPEGLPERGQAESSDLGTAHGSLADPAAAGREADSRGAAETSSSKPATAEPERPRSAFGPGAAARAEPPRPAASGSSAAATRREAEPARREAEKPAAESGARSSTSGRASSGTSKGWSVQLGAFGSRENAERLVKQVKGKGFPVAINENASSKLRYRVRVGPEKDRAAADALVSKLRAAGYKDATVVPPG